MPQARYNLGHVAKLTAKAIGEPGSRYFQVAAEARNGQTVMIWMEKEQLFNLGVQLKRLLYEYQEDADRSSSEDSYQEAVFGVPDPPVIELQAGQMSIGYDQTSAMFFLAAHGVDQEEDSDPLVNIEATYREIDSSGGPSLRSVRRRQTALHVVRGSPGRGKAPLSQAQRTRSDGYLTEFACDGQQQE